MRVRDSLKVRGQRIHVSTLIQSNVYNIITSYSVYSCNAGCVLCVNVLFLCARTHVWCSVTAIKKKKKKRRHKKKPLRREQRHVEGGEGN